MIGNYGNLILRQKEIITTEVPVMYSGTRVGESVFWK